MLTRRSFIQSATLPAAAGLLASARHPFAFTPGAVDLAHLAAVPGAADDIARDEEFWSAVSQAFTVDRNVINLNNGGVSPAPAPVQDAMKRHLDFSNSTPPSIALWRILEPRKEGVRQRLARHWGVDPEELALTRNASESLEICQLGIDLHSGDEVLTTDQDYPRMIDAFRQRERREGIKLRQFSLPTPCEDDEAAVGLFEANITPRTRLILMSHVIFLTGQILPVAKVVAMARRHQVPVIVDGAHALAHVPFRISDLGCDYYGTSLHKWLFAPHGTGLLYVRKEKISGLWPLMPAREELSGNIRKFEEIGTHPAANTLAIAEALTFHQAIGDERKAARLRVLRDRWAKRLLEKSDRVRLHTSLDPRYSCGIATVEVEGIELSDLVMWLEEEGIIVTGIEHHDFRGIRVSPSVYTTLEDIDRFAEAIESRL